jgi:hypothetical protein
MTLESTVETTRDRAALRWHLDETTWPLHPSVLRRLYRHGYVDIQGNVTDKGKELLEQEQEKS